MPGFITLVSVGFVEMYSFGLGVNCLGENNNAAHTVNMANVFVQYMNTKLKKEILRSATYNRVLVSLKQYSECFLRNIFL